MQQTRKKKIQSKKKTVRRRAPNAPRGWGGGEGGIAIPRKELIPNSFQTVVRSRWNAQLVSISAATCNTYIIANALASSCDVAGSPTTSIILVANSLYRQMYTRYRVRHIKWKLTAVNNESFPVRVAIGINNDNLSSSKNSAVWPLYSSGETYKSAILSPVGSGGALRTITGSLDLVRMFGNRVVLFDDNFIGATSPTAPTNGFYLHWGITPTNSALSFANGIDYQLELEQTMLFQEKTVQTS